MVQSVSSILNHFPFWTDNLPYFPLEIIQSLHRHGTEKVQNMTEKVENTTVYENC